PRRVWRMPRASCEHGIDGNVRKEGRTESMIRGVPKPRNRIAESWGRLPACHCLRGRLEACPTREDRPMRAGQGIMLAALLACLVGCGGKKQLPYKGKSVAELERM